MTWKNDEEKREALRATGHNPAYWFDRPPRIAEITAEIDLILSATHGRTRTELRKRISNHCAVRELAIEAGKIGKPLASLLDKSRNIFDMETFRTDDEHILTDMAEIHRYITDFFTEWFAGEKIDTEGMHADTVDWQRLLTDRQYYNNFQSENKVEPHLQDILWRAIQKTQEPLNAKISPDSDTTVKDHIEATLTAPPTLAEFKSACKNTKGGDAPGPSGLTWQMVSNWSDPVVEHVYNLLISIHADGSSPQHWAWKWLAPIPKVTSNVTVKDLRPLSLIEVLRKLWNGIQVRKVWPLLAKHNLLHNAQNAYLRNRGCKDASIQLINALEEAEQAATLIALSSWDFTRAFDSVSHIASKLSLYRFGIPHTMCSALVNNNARTLTFIKSPAATKHWNKHIKSHGSAESYTHTNPFDSPAAPFIAKRGVGQGDVDSTLIWNCFMDILLCALDTEEQDIFKVKGPHDIIHSDSTSIAYADDMQSIAASREALQKKADIVSAFSITFRIKINLTKLRTLLVQHGLETAVEKNPTIIVHTEGWEPNTISLKKDNNFKALGIKHSQDNDCKQHFNDLRNILKRT